MTILLTPLIWLWGKYQKYLILAGAILGAVITIYAKGRKDQAAIEARKNEEAVRNVQGKYVAIDERADDFGTVVGRLRDGSF